MKKEETKARRGRPRQYGLRRHVQVLLEPEIVLAFDAWCERYGFTRTEAITDWIRALQKAMQEEEKANA